MKATIDCEHLRKETLCTIVTVGIAAKIMNHRKQELKGMSGE